ncbi:MAG TPA: sulfur globule protein CV1, partial [Chromatiaceae bacterium]|nr:sulfur globule protein CV1 [Chromatiaceae bacterium]
MHQLAKTVGAVAIAGTAAFSMTTAQAWWGGPGYYGPGYGYGGPGYGSGWGDGLRDIFSDMFGDGYG